MDFLDLGFPIGIILAIFFYLQVTPMLLPSFKSNGLLFQEKKRKIDFQDGGHDGYFGLRIGKILIIFALQDTPMLQTKIQDSWPFSSGQEAN